MPRHVYALDLVDDARLIAEYRARHAPGAVWPQILAQIAASGVEAMEIWQVDDRLVMVCDTADDYPRPVADPDGIAARWEGEMDHYQRPLRPGGPKWLPMARIFTTGGSA